MPPLHTTQAAVRAEKDQRVKSILSAFNHFLLFVHVGLTVTRLCPLSFFSAHSWTSRQDSRGRATKLSPIVPFEACLGSASRVRCSGNGIMESFNAAQSSSRKRQAPDMSPKKFRIL